MPEDERREEKRKNMLINSFTEEKYAIMMNEKKQNILIIGT